MKNYRYYKPEKRNHLTAFEIMQVMSGFGMYTIAVITCVVLLLNAIKK